MSKVEFILDEAAMLGPLDAIDSAIGIGRGYGVRLQFYYQSLGQLRKCFPDGQDQTVLSNVSQVFFAVNDNATADYVSTRLGDFTVIVDSGGNSRGTSTQHSQGAPPSQSHGYSTNHNDNWNQQARRLLKMEEVLALSPRLAITFTPGVPPLCTRVVRYYEEKNLGSKVMGPSRMASIASFIGWMLRLGLSVMLACMLMAAAGENARKRRIAPRPRQIIYREEGEADVPTR